MIADNPFYKGYVADTNIGVLEAPLHKPPIASNTSGYNGVYKKQQDMDGTDNVQEKAVLPWKLYRYPGCSSDQKTERGSI